MTLGLDSLITQTPHLTAIPARTTDPRYQISWVRPYATQPAHLGAERTQDNPAPELFSHRGAPGRARFGSADFIQFASALINTGWTVKAVQLSDNNGDPFTATRHAAYSSILLEDLHQQEHSDVAATMNRELKHVFVDGFSAQYGAADGLIRLSLNRSGVLRTNDVDSAMLVFNTIDLDLVENRCDPLAPPKEIRVNPLTALRNRPEFTRAFWLPSRELVELLTFRGSPFPMLVGRIIHFV